MSKEKKNRSLTLYTKINTKWIKDLNVIIPETIKVPEGNGESKFDIGLGNDFSGASNKSQDNKGKIK